MELHEKLQQQYDAIQCIKRGEDTVTNKATLMMQYINAETSMEAIHLFATVIDENIGLYEITTAYTWFILGYNYLIQQPLDRYDSDLYQKLYHSEHGDGKPNMSQEEHFNLFKEFYKITLEELNKNEA